MKLENFIAGEYRQQYKYKSFTPSKINHAWSWEDGKINTLLAEANRQLGALDAFSKYVPDMNIFIEMHVAKEAAKSSKIEGTKTEIDEAIKSESEIDPEKKDDWQEVRNYIEAIDSSINRLKEIPLSTRLLKEAHAILMQGVRGEHKNPGEYRTSQNWIGGATIDDAAYIPPNHIEINDLMGDLEKFLHNDSIEVPSLIRAAIAHYQFEIIHPFLDGNGRIGRLLIILYLVSSGELNKPSLYLSDYFEKHRMLYYDNLSSVRVTNSLHQWIKFFLVGIIETSKKGIETFSEILKLKEIIEEEKIVRLGEQKIHKAKKLIKHLYSKPVVTAKEIHNVLNVSLPTANSLASDFENLGILIERTGWKRNREFEFKDYLDLFRDL